MGKYKRTLKIIMLVHSLIPITAPIELLNGFRRNRFAMQGNRLKNITIFLLLNNNITCIFESVHGYRQIDFHIS